MIVLASGRGERFATSGGTGPQLQASLDGCTVLERTLMAVHASGLPWHLEMATHPGLGDSIATGSACHGQRRSLADPAGQSAADPGVNAAPYRAGANVAGRGDAGGQGLAARPSGAVFSAVRSRTDAAFRT